MVLINETKYACQACIKGHRSSSCLHHDRPLFEVAKKGRPVKQCEHCRELRKSKAVHVKCLCATPPAGKEATPAEAGPSNGKAKSRRKDPTLGAPALPNGLRDIHDMSLAADVLKDLSSGASSSKQRVDDLLNPCACLTGGSCTCCVPRKKPLPAAPSPPTAPSPAHPRSVAESLATEPAEFDRPALSRSNSSSGRPSRRTSISGSHGGHKTPLYSPYPVPAFNASGSRISIRSSVTPGPTASVTTPEAVLRQGLKDLVSNYMKAKADRVQNALVNFSISTGQDATANGAGPGVETGSQALGEQIEEILMVSTCTCGDDCACPSCKEHGNAPADGIDPGSDQHGCGDNCSSCFACSSHVAMPANLSTTAALQTVSDLLASSSARLPPPPLSTRPYDLDPHNLSVLPRSAFLGGDESRAAFGLMQVPKLECCFGRCRCPPGECSCMSDCCGCCDKCLCDDDDEAVASGNRSPATAAAAAATTGASSEPEPVSSCCSTKTEVIEVDIPTVEPPPAASARSSCCAPKPTPVPAKSNSSCCAPPAPASSTSAAGKKPACGSASCGGKSAQPPPRLRPLLPKPPAIERLASSQAPVKSSAPSGGSTSPGPSSSFGVSGDASAVPRLAEEPILGTMAAGQPLSPEFLAALLGQSPGAGLPSPVFGRLDSYTSSYGAEPTVPAISDAELDELMATLAAANGGSLDGLDWDAALGAQTPSFGFDAAAAFDLCSPQAGDPSGGDFAFSDSQPLSFDSQRPTADDPPFDLRAFVDSFATSPRPSQPDRASVDSTFAGSIDALHGSFYRDPDPSAYPDFDMSDPALLASAGVDWNALLAESPPL